MHQINVHSIIAQSRANGPGVRTCIWFQGCTLGCPGCFNPETHSIEPNQMITVDALFDMVLARQDAIEGVTFSGGEPLQQPDALLELLKRLRRETTLSALLFSGYTLGEIMSMPQCAAILSLVDVLIAGRYDESKHTAMRLLGSANQEVHFLTPRYSNADLEAVPCAEVIITPDAGVLSSGINPFICEAGAVHHG